MSHMRVARRYALALIETAKEQKNLEKVAKDIDGIRDLLEQSREMRLFFVSPIIQVEKKRSVVQELFSKNTQPLTLEFLLLLVDKRREDVLPEIIKQFMTLHDEQLGIVNVNIKTVVPFTGEQEKLLLKKLETISMKKVRATFSIDKAIQGGFIARADDTVFDGSIRRQFELLRDRFVSGSYERN